MPVYSGVRATPPAILPGRIQGDLRRPCAVCLERCNLAVGGSTAGETGAVCCRYAAGVREAGFPPGRAGNVSGQSRSSR